MMEMTDNVVIDRLVHGIAMAAQDESIYCLIPPVIEPPPKPPLYRSRYPGTVPANKRNSATMGPLKVPGPDPHRYLKAYTREDNKLPERKCPSSALASSWRPSVISRLGVLANSDPNIVARVLLSSP